MKAYASEITSFHLGIFEGQCLRPSITDDIRCDEGKSQYSGRFDRK